MIWRTPPYADYHWLARPGLDKRFGEGFTNRIRQTLLNLTPEQPRSAVIMDLFGAKTFIPAEVSNYDRIEAVGRQLGKIR